MSSIERLKEMGEEAVKFHNAYVKTFTPFLSEAKFNKFRLYFINHVQEDLADFFNSSYHLQLVVNTMHIGLKVWSGIAEQHKVPNEVFNFFFIAACMIVLKLECPEKVKRLKNWACNINANIDFVLWAERLILNHASWDLYLNTPSEYAGIILEDFIRHNILEEHFCSLKELISTWIHFGLNEYPLYHQYDQVTLTLASIYIGLSQHDNVSKETFDKFISFLERNALVGLNQIQQCADSFMQRLESYSLNNDEEDLSELIQLTRANSTESLPSLEGLLTQCSKSPVVPQSNTGDRPLSSLFTIANDDLWNIKGSSREFLSRKRGAAPLDVNMS